MDWLDWFKWNIFSALAGLALDFVLGDPENWPHPVIWMGRYIARMEKKLRARGGKLRRGAVLLALSTVALSMGAAAAVLFALSLMGRAALFAGMCVMAWTTLSAKCLAREGRGVAAALDVSLEAGRRQVGRIVGRDTAALTRPEILRATVETIAENTTDGVIAPMLYLALGGPVLAMGFKAASTLDSMVGYLDPKYRDIGWFSAKLDDALNYIPARICGALLCAAAAVRGLDARGALRVMRRDHANHLSPNCAWSESAVAGALGVQLGGAHTYFGKQVKKPVIGDANREIERADIARAIGLMYGCTVIFAALMLGLAVIM